MTLRNEIFEGLAAWKGMNDVTGNNPRDRYYETLAQTARIPLDEYKARKTARDKAIGAGRPGGGAPALPQALASTATPGTPPTAFQPTAMPAQATPGVLNYNYQHGGKVEDDDVGSHRARADAHSIAQGERDFGRNNSNIRGAAQIPSGEPTVSPLIQIYPERRQKFQSGGTVMDEQGMPYRESQPFDPEGDGYDYDQARAAGMGPGEDGHWSSREPGSGLQLKGRKHPTFDKAIETDRMQGYGLEKQKGRYYTKQFADGGMVDDEAEQNEADLIVRSLINRDVGDPDAPSAPGFDEDRAAAKINRQVGEPWTVTGANSEYQTQGSRDKMSNEKALGETQAMDTTRMQESAPVAKGRSRLERATDWMKPDPAAVGQGQRRRALRKEINQTEPGLTEELTDSELRQREEKVAGLRGQIGQSAAYGAPEMPGMPEVGALVPDAPDLGGVTDAVKNLGFKAQIMTPGGMLRFGKPAAPGADTTAVARGEINETGGTPEGERPSGPYPIVPDAPPPVPTQTPVPGPNTAQVAGPGAPTPQGDRPTGNTRAPNQTPTGPATAAATGAPVPATSNGPPNTSMSGPSGTTAAPAPPMGSAGANRPSSAPKPRKALNDQTRDQAFDPVADREMAGNVQPVDAAGRSHNPQEIQQLLSGAAAVMPQANGGAPPPVGTGAVTRQNFNQYVQGHSQGGAFSPGEAMLVGMLSDYKMLMSQGHVDQANKMAFGLIQAASLEAASYGYVARDMLKQGNFQGALQNTVAGLNYLPDGKTFKVGPDGKSIIAIDSGGQVSGQQAMSPQQLLAAITGISDGSLLWNALQASAAMIVKPDKNAEGRGLSNQIKRNTLKLQEKRLNAPAKGGGTAGLSPAATEASARLAALGGGTRPPQQNTTIVQGSDDDADPGAAIVAGERLDDDG